MVLALKSLVGRLVAFLSFGWGVLSVEACCGGIFCSLDGREVHGIPMNQILLVSFSIFLMIWFNLL